MRIVRLLVGSPPQTVSDLIKTSGVTRTAVTEQLNELVAAGYVERTIERLPGRGRPRHLYSATNATLLALFGGNEQLVVPAIWQAVEEIGGEDLLQQVLKRVASTLADHYRQRMTAERPKDRLREMAEILCEEGGLAEVHDNGRLVLQKRSCAFFCMFDSARRAVCHVDEEMLSLIVGQPVRRIACRHDGDSCCSFEIVPGSPS
jgi:predicted ArsR family transcriptional regulator